MEKMVTKVCLDTSIVIALLKKKENYERFLNALEECELYISSITVFELFMRKSNLDEIEKLVSQIMILPFGEAEAKKASELFKKQAKEGKTVDFRDLFIAATAINKNCKIFTLDNDDFGKIKDVMLLKAT